MAVVGAMHDEQVAVDARGHALEAEVLELAERALPVRHAEDAQDLLARGAQRRAVAQLRRALARHVAHAPHHAGVGVEDRAHHGAGPDALLEGHGARRVVAAPARGHQADARGVHVGAAHQPVDAGRHGPLEVVARGQAVHAQRRALARAVEGEGGDAAPREVLRHVEHLLLVRVEAVRQQRHRPRPLAPHGGHQVGRDHAALERDVDQLDLRVAMPGEAREA